MTQSFHAIIYAIENVLNGITIALNERHPKYLSAVQLTSYMSYNGILFTNETEEMRAVPIMRMNRKNIMRERKG